MRRPTLDGLTASGWFLVAERLAIVLLLGVLLWFVVRWVRQGLRYLADLQRIERERHERWLDATRARRFRSQVPDGYLRERGRGLVADVPTPFPFNADRRPSDGR